MRVLGRRRSIYLVLLVICAVLSLRPMPLVNSAIDLVFLPTRVIAEIVAPLSWLRADEVRAAEVSVDAVAREVRGSAKRLLSDEQDSARPTKPELLEGRRLIHGEVVRRSRGNLDLIEVRVATTEGIVPDLPVVTGNQYIGRVAHVDKDDAYLIHVQLVTDDGFYVGAATQRKRLWRRKLASEAVDDAVEFVVGGLATRLSEDDEQLHLRLHHPILRGVTKGHVYVSESPEFDEQLARLSHGFSLGELQTLEDAEGSRTYRIQSPLDFKSGLFQVIVLTPEDGGDATRLLELDTFVEGNWVAARTITRGDVSAAREGRRISKGTLAEVHVGQAVALGAHLVGRVGDAGPLSADLLGLGDPGLRLAVLAQMDGELVPRPIGEIVSLGRDREEGWLRFRWTCRIDLEPAEDGGPLRADLYTGSGEEGVPRGLYIGWVDLPTERATHEIAVVQDAAVRELNHVFVWTGKARAEASRTKPLLVEEEL